MVSIPPGSSLGRYRVIEQLGRGGMATVFRCHDPNLDRYVAVKVLPSFMTDDPTFIGRFTQEAQTIARLNHPNILRIYDFGEDKGFTYIVSEIVPGGDLQDRLHGDPLELSEVLKYIDPLADALDYAHGQGIVHRDLKPANVLLDKDERPILADFGLARMLESSTRFTQEHQALGTPEYMSPEQAMGADADHRSDLYALGIMVFQMLLGQTPFHADTPAATLMAHVHRPLPLPTSMDPSIEPKLEGALLKSLAKQADDRFQSAREMVSALGMSGPQPIDPVQQEGAMATAVLDLPDLQPTQELDMPTAVVGTEAALQQAGRQPATGPPGQTPPAAAGPATGDAAPAPAAAPSRTLLYVGGGAAALVAVVAAVAVLLMSGGGDAEPPGPAPAVVGAPAVAPAPAPGVVAVPAEGTYPGEEPQSPQSVAQAVAALEQIIDRAKQSVIGIRAVTLDGQIQTEFKTREELASITRGFFRRPALRQEVFEAEELYKAIGLMAEDQDLEDILLGIQLQQITAVFDDASEKVFVISDASNIGPAEELGIAAAYMGGIQQSLFDVANLRQRARDAGTDQARALDAFVRGDVAQVAGGYIATVFTKEQEAELRAPIAENKLLAAPEVVQKANRFQQIEGQNFVADLFSADGKGWAGVDEGYLGPPVSTEQIIHPDKYLAAEKPVRATVPDVARGLGQGWTQVSSGTMGEFLLRTYLEQHLDDRQAADAAAGWGGDGFSLLTGPEGQRLMISLSRWDTFQDSSEFFDAFQIWAGIRYQGAGATSTKIGDSGRKWMTSTETIFVGHGAQGAVLLITGDEEQSVGVALELLFKALQAEFTP